MKHLASCFYIICFLFMAITALLMPYLGLNILTFLYKMIYNGLYFFPILCAICILFSTAFHPSASRVLSYICHFVVITFLYLMFSTIWYPALLSSIDYEKDDSVQYRKANVRDFEEKDKISFDKAEFDSLKNYYSKEKIAFKSAGLFYFFDKTYAIGSSFYITDLYIFGYEKDKVAYYIYSDYGKVLQDKLYLHKPYFVDRTTSKKILTKDIQLISTPISFSRVYHSNPYKIDNPKNLKNILYSLKIKPLVNNKFVKDKSTFYFSAFYLLILFILTLVSYSVGFHFRNYKKIAYKLYLQIGFSIISFTFVIMCFYELLYSLLYIWFVY